VCVCALLATKAKVARLTRAVRGGAASSVVFEVDDVAYYTFANDNAGSSTTWPFDKDFYFILNVAVGGDWGGSCLGGATPLFAVPDGDMQVDWVRAYAPLPTTPTMPTTSAPSCTAVNTDPWATGSDVPCCASLAACLYNWDSADPSNYYFLCLAAPCPAGSVTLSPTTTAAPALSSTTPAPTKQPTTTAAPVVVVTASPTKRPSTTAGPTRQPSAQPTSSSSCTSLNGDPWASGGDVACCSPLDTCLKNWNGSTPDRWYFLCLTAPCPPGAITLSPTTRAPATSMAPTTAVPSTPMPSTAAPAALPASATASNANDSTTTAVAIAVPVGLLALAGAALYVRRRQRVRAEQVPHSVVDAHMLANNVHQGNFMLHPGVAARARRLDALP